MKSLVGQTISTARGVEITILRRRKARTIPFFPTFYLYDISLGEETLSIRCSELDNLIKGKSVTWVFD